MARGGVSAFQDETLRAGPRATIVICQALRAGDAPLRTDDPRLRCAYKRTAKTRLIARGRHIVRGWHIARGRLIARGRPKRVAGSSRAAGSSRVADLSALKLGT